MRLTVYLLSIFATVPLVGAQAAGEPVAKPNILFLVADDLAARLGCYGDSAAITPNLDRLAREGVLFNHAYAQGSVCTPSRTSFMLGLNNRHAGAEHFINHPETMTLGRWFREHGYQTFSVGKIDHTEAYADPKAWDIRVPIAACKKGAVGASQLQSFDEDLGARHPTGHRFKAEAQVEALDDWARTERALHFLEQERDAEKPFFAAIGFNSPHDPWETTQAIKGAYDPARFTLEWPTPAGASPMPAKALFDDPGLEMSEARQREGMLHYYATVTLMDQQVGRILDKLREKNLLEKTIVVFISDQGFHLGWRGQWHKHTISEQVLRVPLIVRVPQGVKGAKADGIVELLDLFPTFCDLAGLPAPGTLDGQSFLPLLKDPKAKGKAAAFTSMPEMWGNGRTVRTPRWRLVERLDGSRELYDHANDPLEYRNVITNPEHTSVADRLQTLLDQTFGPLPKRLPSPSDDKKSAAAAAAPSGAKPSLEKLWNGPVWGEPQTEPVPGNTYRLTGNQTVIGGGAAGDFTGAALKLDYITTAVNLRGTACVNLLGARYGGTVRAWAAGPVELSGTVDVPNAEDNLTLAVWDGSMTVRSKLAGCGTVNISAGVPGPFIFAGDASAFTGTLCLLPASKEADYPVTLDADAPQGRLALASLASGKGKAILQLKGHGRFAVITVPRAGGGVLYLPNGRYRHAALKAAGADMACFADLGGELEVLGMETHRARQTALLLPGNEDNTVSLAGKWRFALDPADAGVQEKWHSKTLAERIRLPGVLQAQGFGNPVSTNTPWITSLNDPNWQDREAFKPFFDAGNVKVPYFSQPPGHYLGAAWYQCDIKVPSSWSDRRVALVLERPHWQTDVWLDGRAAGFNKALEAPHLYDLGAVPPGRHVLTIRVDNRKIFPLGDDSHSISDQLGGTWNGIVGRMELQAVPTVCLDTVKVYPRAAEKKVRLVAVLRNAAGAVGRGTLTARATLRGAAAPAAAKTVEAAWAPEGATVELELPLGPEARLWDEFTPSLYDVCLELKDAAGAVDRRTVTFGLRDFSTSGTRFAINGRPFPFRGTHFGGDFPLTGYPAMEVDAWRRIISVCKSYGLNAMRFHSWCPPEAAFAAADELGFYLQPECGSWSGFAPGSPTEQFIYEEAERLLAAYGNHPSFVMLCHGNEPWGQEKDQVLFRWVEHFKKQDPRRLYAAKTGIDPWAGDPSDYMTLMYGANRTYMRAGSGWFGKDYRKGLEGIAVPVMSHEIGEWFALPDFDALIDSLTGYMRPGNIEVFRDIWQRTGMLSYNKAFVQASGRFQTLCYKEEIEANRRTPGMGGFQLLDLRDYLGQGTSLVGVVDPLWNPKSYVSPAEYRRFCGTTAPLARMTKQVYRTGESFKIEVEIAHDGPAPLTEAKPQWNVLDAAGKSMAHGTFPVTHIATGTNTALGTVEADLAAWPAPARYKLVVGLEKTGVENDWNFWLYPEQVSATAPADVLVTRDFDEAEVRLSGGGKVLFLPRLTDLEWASPMTRETPVFWNDLLACQWSRFMGLWCDPKHPALAAFPTDSHFDWQWRELIERGRCRALRVTQLKPKLKPIVYVIDQLSYGQKLAMVFECRVGSGRLLVCSADVESQLESRTVARQLRRSLLDYAASQAFKPSVSLTAADLRTLLLDNLAMKKLGGSAKGDAQLANKPASAAIDGDPNTSWQSGPGGTGQHPHWLEAEFPSPVDIEGLVYLPQQYNRLMEGGIRGYRVDVSRDGTQWTEVAQGEWPASFAPQTVRFPAKQTVRKVRLTSLSGVGDDTVMSVAELTPLYAGPKLPPAKDGKVEYKKVRTSTEQVVEPEAMESATAVKAGKAIKRQGANKGK